MPYQVFGKRPGAASRMTLWSCAHSLRSGSCVLAMAASTSFSPSAPRFAFFNSRARSFIAARSSAVNPDDLVAFLVAMIAFLCGYSWRVLAPLLHAQQVAGGIAEGAIAYAVGLLGRLFDDFGAAGLDFFESGVEVLGGQQHHRVGALGHHLGNGALFLIGDAGAGRRRKQHDVGVRLVRRSHRDPAQAVVADVV